MTSILLEIERIRRTRFNCNDLEDQKLLHILVCFFLLLFLEATSNFKPFEKKDNRHSYFPTECTGS